MLTVIHVDAGTAGQWIITATDRPDLITTETLDRASHLAHRLAEERCPCELVIRNAYHHVIECTVID